MADKEVPEGLDEIGRDLLAADQIIVNKRRSPLSRVLTFISAAFSAGTGLSKVAETFAIAPGGVGTTQIADAGVTTAKLLDGAVTEAKLDTGAVVEAKLGAGAVTETKLGSSAVTETKLAANAVATAKIAAAAVTPAKLASWPAASARRAGGAQSLASGSTTVIDLDNQEFASGGADAPTVDLANNRITIGRAGIYRVSGQVAVVAPAAPTAGASFSANIAVNGTLVAMASTPMVASTAVVVCVTRTLSLAAGDHVDLRAGHVSGSSLNTLTLTHQMPSLQLEYVGPA